jgi:hypothetical protein
LEHKSLFKLSARRRGRATTATGHPLEFFTLLVGQRVVESKIGLGVDCLKLAGEGADDRGELVDFGVGGVATGGVAEGAAGLIETVFERLGVAVGVVENREGLTALGFGEIEAAREVMDAAFSERFLVVPRASGLSQKREGGEEGGED